jgi:hypothetical protein
MKFITHIIKEIMPSIIVKITPKQIYNPLGRWNMEICNKKINNKIDLANEDHCGTCGEYALKKLKNKK